MQPSITRDRVRGNANIAGDERRTSGVIGPSAESSQNMSGPWPQPSSTRPIKCLHSSGVLQYYRTSHALDENWLVWFFTLSFMPLDDSGVLVRYFSGASNVVSKNEVFLAV